MSKAFFNTLAELSERDAPFVVATVVKIEGSASAKPGAKSIIDADGKTVFGWVGGGCAESAVREEALASLKDGQTRVIPLDLDDEVLGVGMPCGGIMEVYIEPFLPPPRLVIVGHGRIAEVLATLAHLLNFSVTVVDSAATKESFPMAERLITDGLDFSGIGKGTNTYVVVATQHKNDHLSIKKSLEIEAAYIALVASRKRSELVFSYLLDEGIDPEELSKIHAPAGIDLGGTSPEEIAFSVMSEILAVHRGGTCRPLVEIKGSRIPKT
jgi:xanthine dehydrogenase accessory factor